MGLAAGRLTRRVRIQSRTDADDDGGGLEITWADDTTTWASIEPGAGREFNLARQETPELSHIVTVRYRSGLTAKKRFVYGAGDGARVFTIHAVADPAERHEQLVCYCEELKAT